MSGFNSSEAIRDAMSNLRQTEPAHWWAAPGTPTSLA
jgi:hypothetical protein